jgi:hypothetical protein
VVAGLDYIKVRVADGAACRWQQLANRLGVSGTRGACDTLIDIYMAATDGNLSLTSLRAHSHTHTHTPYSFVLCSRRLDRHVIR